MAPLIISGVPPRDQAATLSVKKGRGRGTPVGIPGLVRAV